MIDLIAAGTTIAPTAVDLGLLVTALLLGVRHGIDWDHIAAITDITSTTAAAGMGDAAHAGQHRDMSGHAHGHGGDLEMRAHDAGPGGATLAPALATRPMVGRTRFLSDQAEAIRLGTLYALGHGLVVVVLGLAAIAFGALLPDWLDPMMARIVGLHPRRPRRVGPLLDLPLRAGGRAVPAAEPLDARVRRDPLRLAPPPGAPPRARARRAARDELVRGADLVRGRDDPRDRRRDGLPGPADRRGRRSLEPPASGSRCCSRSSSGCFCRTS